MKRFSLVCTVAMLAGFYAAPARAMDPGYALHAEGSAARMVGEGKQDQFGFGGGGLASAELTLGNYVGLELPVGALAMSDGDTDEAGYMETAGGYGVFALPGVRVRPFGRDIEAGTVQPGGIWLAAGGGAAYTGDVLRPTIDARLGYDFLADGSVRVGPSLGFMQIVEPDDSVRPQDARVVLFGIHLAFEPVHRAVKDDDRDDDGIRDAVDQCPDDPEDYDQWQDRDGCPDPDNDGDKIEDLRDLCPNEAEDYDGFEDHNGCPDRDNDDDGLIDAKDGCPDEAEDIDGFEDADGCPDNDNDGDGIADTIDQCPLDPETVNGYADDDGCPDDGQVRVVGNEIVLDDRVHFPVNRAEVMARSWPLLSNLAKLLIAHPQYARVRIQGHADDTGAEDYNQKLSERRAEAVRKLLVSSGVSPERLVVEAFGESAPRVAETTVYARTKNRRVEFLILERSERNDEVKPIGDILEQEGK